MAKKNKKKRLRLLILAAVVIAALLLGWCGRGWFGGGKKSASTSTTAKKADVRPVAAPAVDAGLARCRVRADKTGVHLGGKRLEIDDIVKACKAVGEAELVVTGDAKYGAVKELENKLREAGVRIYSAGSGPR